MFSDVTVADVPSGPDHNDDIRSQVFYWINHKFDMRTFRSLDIKYISKKMEDLQHYYYLSI